MPNLVISLTEEEVSEVKIIVMDEDKEEAFKFLKKRILPQIEKKEKSKLDVDGKTHL